MILVLAACAPAWKDGPHDRLYQVEPIVELAPSPKPRTPSDLWNKVDLSFVRPLGQLVSPATYARAAFGSPAAHDVNRFGEVPDSSWFENRVARRPYTDAEVATGAAIDGGMAPGPLHVISGKIDGVSAGFVVRDEAGQVWYLKLDHPGFPELSTGAEVISSRLLWLAGYHVPAMGVDQIDRKRFVLDPKATTPNELHERVPLTARELGRLLVNTNPDAQGRIRVLFSRQPPGEVIGPFSYRGTVADDPNDTITHEDRRSLRALWLFAAWLNNTDTREANTLDMFRPITPDKRGLVEHYLIDFGDSFGATGLGEKAAIEGWEYLVDWSAMFLKIGSFGLHYPEFLDEERSSFRGVGLFESAVFDPEQWRPALPNPAFDRRNREDLFWAASILAHIQPAQIKAAISAGHYSEPGADAYVLDTLIARRNKLLQYAFIGFLEIDHPRIAGTKLQLDDLLALGDLPQLAAIEYTVRWNRTRGLDRDLARGVVDAHDNLFEIDLASALAAARSFGIDDDPFLTIQLARHGAAKCEIHVRVAGDRLIVVGLDR